MSTYIAPAALGLGDLAVILPVVQSLIASGEQTYLVLRLQEHGPVAERIAGLAGALFEWQFSADKLRTTDEYYDLRDHYLQKRYWWGSREFEQAYPGFKINDILRVICNDLGLEVDFRRLQPLTHRKRPEVSGKIVFVPGSAVSAKHWPTECWLQLAQKVRHNCDGVVVIGQPNRCAAVAELKEAGLTWLETATIGDAIDVVSSCLAVVSVDTGLMHLAVNQGTPTVGIFKRSPVYIRPHNHFRAAISERSCMDVCHEKERRCAHNDRVLAGPAFQPADWPCQAPAGARCLEAVSADNVAQLLIDVIAAVNKQAVAGNLLVAQ
jgi:hypothetical protein